MIKIDSLNWKNCRNFNLHAYERMVERDINFKKIKNLSWYIYDDRKISRITKKRTIKELHNYKYNICLVVDFITPYIFDIITMYSLSEYKRKNGLKKLNLRY